MRDALAGVNRATAFHHHQFSLAGAVRAKRGTPGLSRRCFIGKLGNVASVQGGPDDSRFLLVTYGCDFHHRAARRFRHDHHAVVIRADDVARMNGNTHCNIASLT